jgi:hypothetical protein
MGAQHHEGGDGHRRGRDTGGQRQPPAAGEDTAFGARRVGHRPQILAGDGGGPGGQGLAQPLLHIGVGHFSPNWARSTCRARYAVDLTVPAEMLNVAAISRSDRSDQ